MPRGQFGQRLDDRSVIGPLAFVPLRQSAQSTQSAGPLLAGAWAVTAYAAKSRRVLAVIAFFDSILQDSVIQGNFGGHLLQAPIFSLQRLEPPHIRGLHSAVPRAP